MKQRWLTIAMAGALVGCATTHPAPRTPDPVQLQLAAAAQSVRTSLRQLAEAEQFDKMKRLPSPTEAAPVIPGLERKVSMPWNGPLQAVVEKLATLGGYEVQSAGRPPSLPILISLGPEPVSLAQQLRDVGLQAGNRADIVVDPTRRKVEVIYADTGL